MTMPTRPDGRLAGQDANGDPGPSLEQALAGAREADRSTRIEWRDAIARHGLAAIDAVFEWAGDHEFGFFAVRVIEAVGRMGERDAAVDALVAIRSIGATETVRRDASDAIHRLLPSAVHSAARRPIQLSEAAGLDWPGFAERDFGDVTATTWRRRTDPTALVPLLLRPLLELDANFSTYPLYRLPEVHFAVRDRYEQGAEHQQGWRASKLVVYANGPRDDDGAHVAVGLYVEKGTGTDEFGPVDRALWDWPRFLDLLANPARRRLLELTFERYPLRVGEYIGGRFDPDGATVGFVGQLEEGELVLRDPQRLEIGRGWESLRELLLGLPVGDWHNLHIWREWPADEAIARRQPFAVEEMLPVLRDLARVYLAVVGPVAKGTGR